MQLFSGMSNTHKYIVWANNDNNIEIQFRDIGNIQILQNSHLLGDCRLMHKLDFHIV